MSAERFPEELLEIRASYPGYKGGQQAGVPPMYITASLCGIGLSATCGEERSQIKNKQAALVGLRAMYDALYGPSPFAPPTAPEAGTLDVDAAILSEAAWWLDEDLGFVEPPPTVASREEMVAAIRRAAVASRARTAGGTRVVVPELTGCCANCGAMPEITMGPVNDTVCIGVKPTCDCIKRGALYASFHLWPAHGVSATTAGGTPGWEDVLDAFENICPGAVDSERERVEQGFPADVGSVCRIVTDVVRELEQQIEELRAALDQAEDRPVAGFRDEADDRRVGRAAADQETE